MAKGFELQFHWIFILIAGALILAFFFSIAQKQKVISEQRLEFSISSELEGVVAAAIGGKGSARIIQNPGVSFSCKEGCACTLKNRDAKELIFGLTSGGDTLSLWSKEVLMPYRVANLLFLTDEPKIRLNSICSLNFFKLCEITASHFGAAISSSASIYSINLMPVLFS